MASAMLAVALQQEEQDVIRLKEQGDQSANRFLFTPFQSLLMSWPPGIPPLEPGQIHLIGQVPQRIGSAYLESIMASEPNRKLADFWYDRRSNSGEVRALPGVVADNLVARYQEMGGIEIETLRGVKASVFAMLDLNTLIFGRDVEFSTPEAYLRRFEEASELIASLKPRNPKNENEVELISLVRELAPNVITELRQAVMKSEQWAKLEAERRNLQLENGERKQLVPGDFKVFNYAGVTPHKQALSKVAANQNDAMQLLPVTLDRLASLAERLTTPQQPAAPAVDWEAFGRGLAKELGPSIVESLNTQTAPEPAKKGNKS